MAVVDEAGAWRGLHAETSGACGDAVVWLDGDCGAEAPDVGRAAGGCSQASVRVCAQGVRLYSPHDITFQPCGSGPSGPIHESRTGLSSQISRTSSWVSSVAPLISRQNSFLLTR